MNFSFAFEHINDLFSLMNAAPLIKNILDASGNAKDLMNAIGRTLPMVVPIIEKFAETLFPQVAVPLRLAAGVMAAFDPNKTLWLQKSLNALMPESPISADGVYGPQTRDAVTRLQEKLGLKVDGWAGNITNTAIQFALNAMFGAGDDAEKVIKVGDALGGSITAEKSADEAPETIVEAPSIVPTVAAGHVHAGGRT